MNKAELQNKINEIGPWHYCHQFQNGAITGTSSPNQVPDKMDRLIAHGAFDRPIYPKVLDLGANSGIISMWFSDNKGSIVDAIECGPKYYPQLELAVKHKGYTGKVIPYNADIKGWCFGENPRQEYDLILFLGTMHHIPDNYWEDIFLTCHKVLLPSGQIVVQTKTELPVLEMLESTEFLMTKKLYDSEFYKRSAWKAMKDSMKV